VQWVLVWVPLVLLVSMVVVRPPGKDVHRHVSRRTTLRNNGPSHHRNFSLRTSLGNLVDTAIAGHDLPWHTASS